MDSVNGKSPHPRSFYRTLEESLVREVDLMSAAQMGREMHAEEVPLAPGRFNRVEYSEQHLTVAGWMFRPGYWLDRFQLRVNGVAVGAEVTPAHQEGVEKKFASLPEATKSGFVIQTVVAAPMFRNWSDVAVCGRVLGRDVGRMSVLFRPDYQAALPDTPVDLRWRVTGSKSPIDQYRLAGLQTFGKFYEAIQRYVEPNKLARLLDWGCGCGRVTSFYLKYLPEAEVHGCDIDRDAVQWCSHNLKGGHFASIPPYPPTSYASSLFDVVTGCSVLTHLRRDLQLEWLNEMKRILRPGGLLLVSVHGDFAAMAFNNPPAVKQEVQTTGISDRTHDHILDGIAPDSYYRGTYQSKVYTCREFARYFQILEYIELGMGNLQDLVVMRKE
jgi:SAM-dependent methyltransferase